MANRSSCRRCNRLYIHHLTSLTVGEGFWALNLDTLFFSAVLGGLFVWFFKMAAERATAGVPGLVQNFVRMLIELSILRLKTAFTVK